MLTILIILLLLGGGGLVFWSVRGSSSSLSLVSARLGRYGLAGAGATSTAVVQSAPRSGRAVVQSVDRIASTSNWGQRLASRLERADLKMTPGEFVTLSFLALVVVAMFGLLAYGVLGLLIGAVVAGVAPHLYVNRRISKRKRGFIEQLADMAQMMGNSMRAGFSIIQSMELVAHEAPKPASQEFERVVTEIKLGLPMDQALEHLVQRMPGEDIELMVVAINVQRQIGGNLSEILAVISKVIRERVRFERDLRTLTAQARLSSYIITALPVFVAVVINFMDAPYESYLYTSTVGHLMLFGSVCLLGLGFFFLKRIANIEV